MRLLATGLWPRFASLVRGSSRRITIVKASASSILGYQSDQPSSKPPSAAVHSAPAPPRSIVSKCSPASRVPALRAAASPPWTPTARSDREPSMGGQDKGRQTYR